MRASELLLGCLWTCCIFTLVCGRGGRHGNRSRRHRVVSLAERYNAEYRYYTMYQMQADHAPGWQGAVRPGQSTEAHSCHHVRKVPHRLRRANHMAPRGLSKFYVKYTEAYGIPILGSANIPDEALMRACYVTRFMFADRYDVRDTYYRMYGRVALIGEDEFTTDIPEYSDLDAWWNQRARGLGATRDRPVSTASVENVLCYSNDRYYNEDILLHEVAHGAHILGAAFVIPDFYHRLRALYLRAKSSGLWKDTYALTNDHEYFAEGVQSFFNNNAFSDTPNGIHNEIDTREKLQRYDPGLYDLLEEVFPCKNDFIHRCAQDRRGETTYPLRMNCDSSIGVGGEPRVKPDETSRRGEDNNSVYKAKEENYNIIHENDVRYPDHQWEEDGKPECVDLEERCPSWAEDGWCARCQDYMLQNCRHSCGQCPRDQYKPGCVDQNEFCPDWASAGECERSPGYMYEYCQLSCRLC